MKRGLIVCLLLLLGLLSAHAEEPQWRFALPADVVDGKGGFLLAVSRDSLLDADFVPQNLTTLKVRATSRGMQLRREAAEALTRMFEAAELEAGHKLYVKSAYRSWQTQNTMYQARLERYGRDDGVVAAPGTSDHQTGLGVDVLNHAWTQREGMTPAFGQEPEARWMEENCARFGFILRYLPEKQDVTGIIYEPWHLRYVGETVAQYIMQQRLALEEFDMQVLAAIADYESQGGDFAAYVRQLNAPPVPVELAESDEQGDGEVSLFYPGTK